MSTFAKTTTMKLHKRDVDLIIISDVHLGTYGCHAKELLTYLRSINPKKVILNGDIIDIWQFSKRYWPKEHMKVVQHILQWVVEGKEVTYITGNHDEMLRKFKGFSVGNFSIVNKVVLELQDNKKAWIFHGDVFDVTMKHSRWLAKLGGKGYEILILINRFVNWVSLKMGRGKISLSKKIKDSVKGAVKHINNFEETAAGIAIQNQYDYVVCGHIHKPEMREISLEEGSVMYLNSGDWVENLTCLEYHKNSWSIMKFEDLPNKEIQVEKAETVDLDSTMLFKQLLEEFDLLPVNMN